MGLFDKIKGLFSSKPHEEETVYHDNIEMNINGTHLNIPVSVTASQLDSFKKNSSDKTSCFGELTSDMVRITDIEPYLKACCPEVEEMFELDTQASLKGYNSFAFPKSKFERVKEALRKREAEDALLQKTVELNNKGIALESENKIDEAIKIYEELCALRPKAHHSYDRLIVLYHQKNDFTNEARIIKLKMEVFGFSRDLERRLAKANGTYVKPTPVYPTERTKYKCSSVPLGDQYEECKTEFAEFDFYNSGDESRPQLFLKHPSRHKLWDLYEKMKTLLKDAQEEEKDGNTLEAIQLYERLVAEHYYLTIAYDRLIILYGKAKFNDTVIEVLREAIHYFSAYREKQKQEVLRLASKYNKSDFAKERIRDGKKITYYNGAFELYNPYPKIETWQNKLDILCPENNN